MLRRILLFSLLISATDVLVAVHAVGSTAEKFRSDTEKLALIEKAAQPWKAVRRWMIEYDIVISPNPQDSHVRMIMAAGSPDKYYKLKAKGFKHIPWEVDPFMEESFIDGDIRCIRWTNNRLFKEFLLRPDDEIKGTISGDILWRAVPVFPVTKYRIPVSGNPSISPILERALRITPYRLQTATETIDGQDCLVFLYSTADAVTKTWVAADSGLCIMKEEIRSANSNELIQRIVIDGINEVSTGIKLPIRYRLQRFMRGNSENKPQRENRVHILRCLFNDDVPDSTFCPVHPPGSIKQVREGENIQVVAGGEDLLLNRVELITKYAPPVQSAAARHRYLWIIAGVASGFGLGLLALPFSRKGGRRVATSKQSQPK